MGELSLRLSWFGQTRVSLAQATSACLGEASRKNRGGFSGVFAQARVTRLGKNTRLRTCSHMQKPRFFTHKSTLTNSCNSNIISTLKHVIHTHQAYFYTNLSRNGQFPLPLQLSQVRTLPIRGTSISQPRVLNYKC